MLGINERTIRNYLRYLIDNNYIIRVGAKENGQWIITKDISQN